MFPIGRRSNTRRRPGACALVVVALLLLGAGDTARALDLFTLWHQQEIALDLTPGSWVLYKSQTMASGRSDFDLTRVSCLPAPAAADSRNRVFEIIPMTQNEQGDFLPVAGQGVWLLVSGDIAAREGKLVDLVREAWQWEDGQAKRLAVSDLKNDPVAAGMLASDFRPDTLEEAGNTTRIISGQQFLCAQLVMSARDSQCVDLPAGRMSQITNHEITAAYHPDLPLLGLAYVAERISSASTLDSPNPRFRAPPPRNRVEIMELVGFGRDAVSLLGPGD